MQELGPQAPDVNTMLQDALRARTFTELDIDKHRVQTVTSRNGEELSITAFVS